jgi:Flp pilus assembly protein TadG
MRYQNKYGRRRGATLVESAIVLPVVLLLLIGLIVSGMGVFRYQELAHIARETARYASVHGGQYATQNPSQPVVDEAALRTYAASRAVSIDTTQWTVSVQMRVFPPGSTTASVNPPSTSVVDWDDTNNNQNRSPYSSWTRTPNGNVTTADNLVIVTITYPWVPEAILVGPITLTSTAVLAMSY